VRPVAVAAAVTALKVADAVTGVLVVAGAGVESVAGAGSAYATPASEPSERTKSVVLFMVVLLAYRNVV
jgi:hypothetical protein